MNLKRIFLLSTSLIILVSNIAQAETPAMYWGAGLSRFEYVPAEATNPTQLALSDTGLALKGGFTFKDWIGLELQYGMVKDSSPNDFGDKLEINNAAAFARFSIPFPSVNLYALAGAAVVKVDVGVDSSERDYVAGGLGFDLMANDRSMLYFEAMRYKDADLDDGDAYMNVYMIGYKYHFNFAGIR